MNLNNEAKVGAITLIGLILLAYMVVHLGGFTFGDKGYQIQAVFSQVNGLKEGNIVRYAGVEVGKIRAVSVTPEGVRVQMLINSGVKIPQGSKFSIGTDGLLGEKYIDIVPQRNTSGFLHPNAVVSGDDPNGLNQLIENADQVLVEVHKLVSSLNEVFGDEKVKASFKDTIFNAKEISIKLNEFSASLASMAQNNEQDINTMVRNLQAVSGNLREVTARVDKFIAAVDNNGQTAVDLRETIHNLKATSVRVEKMAAAFEGVVTDPETSKNIKETLRNARSVSAKADKMLSKVEAVSAEVGFETMYNNDTSRYRSNIDVKIKTSPQDFAIIGVSNIGENSTTNFQVGKSKDQWAGRAGLIEGKAGIGFDAQMGKQMRLSLDAYDPNDVRVKLRAQLGIANNTYIVGEADNLNRQAEKANYLGIRRTF